MDITYLCDVDIIYVCDVDIIYVSPQRRIAIPPDTAGGHSARQVIAPTGLTGHAGARWEDMHV